MRRAHKAVSLIAFSTALVGLAGCINTRCPAPVPMDSLPDSITSRINRARPEKTRVSRAMPSNPDSDLVIRLSSFQAVRPTLRTEDRPVILPMVRQGERWVVSLTVIAASGAEHAVEFKVDTGAHTQIALDSRTARQLGVVVPAELHKSTTHTAFGPKKIHTGVIAGLRLGHATLGPVEVEIECSGRSYRPLIGIRALERFGHAIFDWPNKALILLPRGWSSRTANAATNEDWVSSAWTTGPVAVQRDSIRHEGKGRRRVLVEMTTRWARLTIDKKERVTLIDTGFSGDLFSFEPLGAQARRSGTIVGQGFGRRDTFRTRELANPVLFEGVRLDGLTLIEPVNNLGNMNLVQRSGFEVMAGLGILEQHPMWMDFERNELRFWVQDTPMPILYSSQKESETLGSE